MPGGIRSGGEVLEILGDDRAGSRDDSRSEHMLVVGIGQPESTLERLPPINFCVGELSAHRGDEGRGAAGSLRYRHPTLHKLGFLVELEFVENRRTPCGSVGALDGEGKKVALQARPQHARVESGREHSAILSGDDLNLGRPASLRLPSGPL